MTSAPIPRRAALVTSRLVRNGGTGVHVIGSAQALREAGYELTVIAGDHDPELGVDGLRSIPGLEAAGRIPAETTRRLADAVAAARPDVIHVHDVTDGAVLAALAAQAPLVCSLHNYDFGCMAGYKYFPGGVACHRAHGPGCVANVLFRGCGHTRVPRPSLAGYRRSSGFRAALRQADGVVANSEYLAGDLRINGIERVFVVPPFVHAPAEVSPLAAGRRVLYCGRVTPHKGLETLIAAAAQGDFTIEVCGEGWGMPAARRAAARLGVADRVTFRGWVGPAELDDAYRRATLVAMPSILPETFGLSGVEGMAHGRPVVASAVGGIPEWLGDGRTGVLVPPADPPALAAAIGTLLDDRERCEAMGREGRRRALERYTTAAYVEGVGEVYRHAASGGIATGAGALRGA